MSRAVEIRDERDKIKRLERDLKSAEDILERLDSLQELGGKGNWLAVYNCIVEVKDYLRHKRMSKEEELEDLLKKEKG